MINRQFILDLHDELIVDSFAGGGGASTGIYMGLNRHVDHAFNHAWDALGMHRINHPQTVHHCADVFEIDPWTITEGRPVGLAHFSPDCKHFSKAKGGKPLDKRIRGLVLVMLRWAAIRSRVMTMENVEEIVTWGPLIEKLGKDGQMGWYPDPDNKGRTWQAFLACLSTGIDPHHPDLPEILDVLCGAGPSPERAHWRQLLIKGFGYRYEHREIKAYRHGTPTIRNRLFMVARCDGRPILWPIPTHEDPKKIKKGDNLQPWRTIAECIDWDLPCPSIFLTPEAAKALGLKVKRPLVKATQRRIAKGIDRYVLKAKRPFLVSLTHQGGDRVEDIDEPAKTVTGAHRGEKGVVVPSITKYHGSHCGRADGEARSYRVDEPILAQDTSNRFGLVTGTIVGAGGPEFSGKPVSVDRPGKAQTTENHSALAQATLAPFVTEHANASTQRNMPPEEPMRTLCGEVKGGHMALVSGSLVGAGGRAAQSRPRSLDEPLHTTTAKGDTCLATAHLVKLRGTNIGSSVEDPMHTASAGGTHHGLVGCTLVQTGYGERQGQEPRALDPDKPLGTVVAGACKHGLATAYLAPAGGPGVPPAESGMGVPPVSESLAACYMAQHNGGFNTTVGHSAEEPISTISGTGSQQQVVTASVVRQFGASIGQDVDAPAPTVVAGGGGKTALAACDVAYYGSEAEGQAVEEPMRTATTKARLGHVETTCRTGLTPEQLAGAQRVAAFLREHGVEFEGEFATITDERGQIWVIVDIGMRMLTPRELYRAQGFPEDYIIDTAWIWDPATSAYKEVKLTKEQQIRMCGNSVCPPVMAALILANVPELALSRGPSRVKARSPRRAQPVPA